MLIDCPACARSYHISRTAMGAHGRQVICPRCQETWFVAAELRADDEPSWRRAEREELRAEAVSGRDFPWLSGPVRTAKPRRAALPAAKSGLARPFRPVLAGAALLCAAMLVIGGRATIVRLWPQANTAYATAGLGVNLRGLDVKNLRTDLAEDEARPILTVSGEIANLREGQTKVPAIRLSLRDKTGREIYAWSQPAPKPKLGAHETIAFRARLAAPPEASREVLVRFAEAEPAR